jgi:hypothetical protein
MTVEIREPIFVVGAPRSGTSVLYEKLAMHPDLAWISNVTKKTAGTLFGTRLLMLFRHDHRPTEAKNVWAKFCRPEDESLTSADVTPTAKRYLRKVVANTLTLFGKQRFVCKDPSNGIRIGFLNEIFPDSRFVHIVRDGRAVACSILRNRRKRGDAYWGSMPRGWRDLLDKPIVEACGLQWRMMIEQIREAAEPLEDGRYVELRYEDFTDRSREVLADLGRSLGLPWEPGLLDEVVSDLQSRNYRWRDELEPSEIDTLNSLLGDLLDDLGYEL